MELPHLPLEIQLMIMRSLDYKSLLYFSATNKAFHHIFLQEDKNLLKHALLDAEESGIPLDLNSANPEPEEKMYFLPCYGCHTLLVHCSFTREDWRSPSTRKGPNAFRRRCRTCQAEGKYKFTRSSRVLEPSNPLTTGIYCGGCKRVMHVVPLLIGGIYELRDQLSWARSKASVRRDFRCIFCRAKARVGKRPKKQVLLLISYEKGRMPSAT